MDYKLGSLPSPLARFIIGPSPITPGADYVGRVCATSHPDLNVGDLVYGILPQPPHQGSCAQYAVHKGRDNIHVIPEGWNRGLEELGAVGIAGFTALQALMLGDLPFVRSNGAQRGGKVFINGGSGGTGTFMVQIAKRGMGCESVVATCSGANVELVKGLGADEVLDYRSVNVVEGLKEWSRRNGGQKFDLIIDNVAVDHELYWNAPHYLKENGGRYVQIGGSMAVKSVVSLVKVLAWPAVLGGGKLPFKFHLLGKVTEEEFLMMGRWMKEGLVRTVIEDDNRFELGEVGKAYGKLKGGRTRGKMSIGVDREGL